MALVDLSSDLSRFRSEVSREPKSTPEASKATNNKNFATFQPISEKLSQFRQDIVRQEPKQLESRLESTKLDDIRKFVQQNLLINSVSKYSNINDEYAIRNQMTVSTEMVSSKYGKVRMEEFSSRLTKSNIVPIRQEQGVYNNISPTPVDSGNNEQINNVTNPNIQITRPVQSFERSSTSPNVKPLADEQSNNVTNPNIQITRPPQSFEREDSSPNIKPLPNDQTDNITNPNIDVIRPPQSFDRENTSPDVTPLPGDQTDNIVNPDIDILRKPLFFDREDQSIEISKDLISPINNVTDPKTVLDINILTYERAKQSPFILTDIKQDGFVKNPNIRVFRFDGTTVQTEDNSRLNLDGLPLRFIPISRLESFELPREVDVARYTGESIQTDDNSNLNVDRVIKTIPFGRHENPEGSGFSIIGTQQINFFTDTNAKGFVVRQQKGESQYLNNSQFGWNGKRETAPVVNFFTDTNGRGFTKFAQPGITDYSTESSVFGFIDIQSTDFFDITKKNTSEGFKTFSTLYDSDYKQDSSVYTFTGPSENAPVVNYFDLNKRVTTDGFTKFIQIFDTKYVPDSSLFTWTGVGSNSPETNFFDIVGSNTTVGFHRFAQLYDSKYIQDSSLFDWDGSREDAPETNYFDITGAHTTVGFHRFAQLYDTKYIPESSRYDWDGKKQDAPEINYFDITGAHTTVGFHRFAQLYDTKYIPESSIYDWDGTREDAPEVNYFDISSANSTAGFHRFAQLYDTKYVPESSIYDWDGKKQNAPEVNYFDISGKNSTAGFHRFAQLYDTKYVHESSVFDWDGTRENAPEVNYFDISGRNSTAGFHRFAQLYDTKYVHESSIYDWDGTKQDAPAVNYFDLTSANTNAGFHTFAQKYDTKYIHESSIYDWDGTRVNSPEVNFFDLNKQHQTVGFHRLAQKYDSKYIKDASLFDFDGGYRDAPETDFFDLGKKFASKGFEKFPQALVTRYIKDSSRFDFDGGSRNAPETDYFDSSKKNTSKGFEKFPQALVTRYVKDSSRFDFDGSSRNAPTVNYFPNTNASGFTKFAPKLESEYVPDSSEFTFKGGLPKEVNFFPDDNQSGFINKTPLLESKYVKDSSRFTFEGSLPEPVDFLENISATGFHLRAPALETKYILDVSRFTFKGSRQDAPTTDYFPNDNISGFTKLVEPLVSEFKPDTSRFTFKGTRSDAPAVDYLQNTPALGFQTLAPMLESFYNKESSRFTWNGTKQDAPSVDFFKIPGSNPNGVTGFTTLFNDVTETKLTTEFSRFSFDAVKNYSSVKNVPYTKFFGFNPNERSGFLVNMIDRNSSLYPLLDPSLTVDSPADVRFGIEGERGKIRRQRTTDNVGKYAPITLGGLFWSDGTNTGTATLGNQVPFMKVKSEGFSSTYFRKYEKEVKDSTQRLGFLTKWATTRRSPSPLDNQYNKYKLQAESVNQEVAAFNQPYVVRGIQRDGEVENQRWGFGVTFDDGIARGGVVTQVERIAMDLVRLGKFTLSVKGGLFNLKQVGLQLMNPSVDIDPNTPTSGFLGLSATRVFNPVALLANVATARAGFHIARHGIVSFDSDYLNKYEKATTNRELNERFLSESRRKFDSLKPSMAPGDQTNYNRLIGLMRELLPGSFKPNTSKENIPQEQTDPTNSADLNKTTNAASAAVKSLTGQSVINRISSAFGGPQSFLGIGGTTIRRASHPYLTLYTTAPNLSQTVQPNTERSQRDANIAASTLGFGAAGAAFILNATEPQYPQSAKRDIFYAESFRYSNSIIVSENKFKGLIDSLFEYLVDLGSDPEKPRSIDQPTLKKIELLDGAGGTSFRPRYDLPSSRLQAINQFNAGELKGSRAGNNNFLSDGPASLERNDLTDANAIKRYRTANYDQLTRNNSQRNSRYFNDFRFSLNTRSNTNLDEPLKSFVTEPTVARFDTQNLEERFGFGFQGKTNEQRNLPFLSTVNYQKFNSASVFKQEGPDNFKDYGIAVEKTIEGQKQFFRGDRINIIDYKRANFAINTALVYEKKGFISDEAVPGSDDLVEFYFSSLVLNGHKNCPAEVIVFRATFDSITDNHNPSWNAVKYMGRADPLYVYQGYEREISFGFTVHIGSRDEMRASWRKLNYLASWTAPEYTGAGYIRGPMIRLNIGHLYRKMPGYISSLSYTFDNQGGTWETAKLAEDMDFTDGDIKRISSPGALQLPKTVQVSVSFVPVGVYRPEFRGVMYSLYDDSTTAVNAIETGLMPTAASRVNYFFEYEENGTPKIYTSLNPATGLPHASGDPIGIESDPDKVFTSGSGTPVTGSTP